jgi:transcriptional regulator with XRE-family HTH domain
MKATPTAFSEAVKKLALDRYRSLREAAKDLGIHHGHFCRICNGEVLPEPDLLERLVRTLGFGVLDPSGLFKDYTLAKINRDLSGCRPETKKLLVKAMMELGSMEAIIDSDDHCPVERLTRAA